MSINSDMALIANIHTECDKLIKMGCDYIAIREKLENSHGAIGSDIAWLYLTEHELGLRFAK